jgi:hypothetical protein
METGQGAGRPAGPMHRCGGKGAREPRQIPDRGSLAGEVGYCLPANGLDTVLPY